MSANTFARECSARMIDPAVALENERIRFYLQLAKDALPQDRARFERVILDTLDKEF